MHVYISVAINFFWSWVFVLFYLAGIVFYYGAIQLGVWWFCHVVSLFWGIQFPFHFKSFKTAHRLKYIHIPMVIAGLVLPALPVTLISTAGRVQDSSLPSSKSLQSASLTFYSVILPSNLLFAAGIPLLIIIIWLIHKVIMITTNIGNNSCELMHPPLLNIVIVACWELLLLLPATNLCIIMKTRDKSLEKCRNDMTVI